MFCSASFAGGAHLFASLRVIARGRYVAASA
jgi:hypothetical protein